MVVQDLLPKWKAAKPKDARAHRRYALETTPLEVTWLNADGDVRVGQNARAIDISETGMALELPEPALLLSPVKLHSAKHRLLGHGKVRYCKSVGSRYIIGIAFTDSLRWRPPEGPVVEPIPLSDALDTEENATFDVSEETIWSAIDGTPRTSAVMTPEPRFSMQAQSDGRFLARLPVFVKAGVPLLLALALGYFLMGPSGTSAASVGVDRQAPAASSQGWVTEWASDAAGSRRGRQISLYRPSANQSDYQLQFSGQIESKALGWVFRAADTKNYYGMKIEQSKPGSALFTRFAVIGGRESSVSEKQLPIPAAANTLYNVRLDVRGPRFSVTIQGQPIEVWTDNRLKTGAVGFMNERDEIARTSSVRFSVAGASAGL